MDSLELRAKTIENKIAELMRKLKIGFLSQNFDLARADLKNHFQISTIDSLVSPCIGALI